MNFMRTDVIVIGAGPTGLALAGQFIRYGVDFIVIDKKETTTPHSKAIGVHARTLEIHEQIGLAEKALAQGAVAGKVRLLEDGKIRGEVDLSNIGEGMSAYPFLLVLEQGKHERILHDFTRENGKDVRWQTEMTSFSQTDEGVSVKVKNSSGESETIEAKYLVACDGAKSPARHSLGLEFEGSTFERMFYVADVQIDWEFEHDALHVCLSENSLLAFFPMEGDKQWRIVGNFPEGHEKEEGEILYEEIEERIKAELKVPLDIYNVNWFSTYKVHTRHVNKFSVGRYFLAGDAAHIHSPAGAQGMNTGIQDGYNLAWKLALVLKGKASSEILNTYNEERLENARRLLKTTDRMFQLGAGEEWFTAFVRTHIFPYVANVVLKFDVVKRAIFPLVSQIGINYRESSLSKNTDSFSIKAGDRMPYFLIEEKSIYDRLREPKFHLIFFSDGKEASAGTPEEFRTEFADMLDVHSIPLYPNIAEIFGTAGSFLVLLRPDNYIGLISSGTSFDDVKQYLRKVLS
jgi:2-polyprenyl-6-methoxyphenol hydroxylase-like FAD-dependent oxidoreductase